VTLVVGADNSHMEVDHSGCEVLARDECLRLLSTERLGRLGLHAGALPVILPVGYAVVEDGIVVRTHDRSQLYGATRGAVVAFEVDCPPGGEEVGWSVHVVGLAEEVTDPYELTRLRALPLRQWGHVDADRFVRISLQLVSGRRLSAAVV
jgi:nitroimidazol reductase NimA-like FMN-containing flavoprotein (pyridoxamine 5'-phosphate oxidase superfamily)